MKVSSPSGTSYCIDSTEVTKGHYGAFLATSPSTSGQPEECSRNASLIPVKLVGEVSVEPQWPFPPGDENKPVELVDWCDATVYCKWAGKRLCGRIGGGSNAFDEYEDPERSQWFNACSAGGTFTYPYGNDFVPGFCDAADLENRTVPVKEAAQCRGEVPPFSDIFDMSGNVIEWEGSCRSTDTETGCRVRGGGIASTYPEIQALRCDFVRSFLNLSGYEGLGFRCCADM